MKKKTFELKEVHRKLLQRMNVGWSDCEFGAPEINCKRPYGNSGVHQDMLEIIGLKELREGVYEFKLDDKKWLLKGEDKYNIYLDGKDEESLVKALNKLHEETETALQIVLSTLTFEPGVYKADEYGDEWKRA